MHVTLLIHVVYADIKTDAYLMLDGRFANKLQSSNPYTCPVSYTYSNNAILDASVILERNKMRLPRETRREVVTYR